MWNRLAERANDNLLIACNLTVRVCTAEKNQWGADKSKTFSFPVQGEKIREVLNHIGATDTFTARTTELIEQFENSDHGWVYIIGVVGQPGFYKVGYTKNCPHERLEQIQAESKIPVDLEVKAAFWVKRPTKIEKDCQLDLGKYHFHGEWFKSDYLTVLDTVDARTQDSKRDWVE